MGTGICGFLEAEGSVRGVGFPNLFYNIDTAVRLMVHGDDFFITGPELDDVIAEQYDEIFKCNHTLVSNTVKR